METKGLPKLQIQLNKGDLNATAVEDQLQMIIGGNMTHIGQIMQDTNSTQNISGVNTNILFKRSNSSVSVYFSSGVSLTVEASNVSYNVWLPHKHSFIVGIQIVCSDSNFIFIDKKLIYLYHAHINTLHLLFHRKC